MKAQIIPDKLRQGDEIRVIAPSASLSVVYPEVYARAVSFWAEQGFKITFSEHSREADEWQSPSVSARVADLHEAFSDPNVKAVISCLGGFHVNQILPHIDYDLIRANPKILCGYSDITALLHAVTAKTGLMTYHGPHFSTFGFLEEREYTQKTFFDCIIQDAPITVSPSETAKQYDVIREGVCEGEIIGGNLCTLNLLQGTPYMPELQNSVLWVEDDNIMGDAFIHEFDRNLQSLLQVSGAESVRGIIFGRFDESCKLDAPAAERIIREKIPPHIPVVYGVDFGHVFPMITFPVGGRVRLTAADGRVEIQIIEH